MLCSIISHARLIKVSPYKKLFSYFYPVRIKDGKGEQNPVLELYLYKNQYQLATADALYSDGRRYQPMLIAFRALNDVLASVKSVLVLGTGLGSAVQILLDKGFHPQYTLVEFDNTILKWAMELMPDGMQHNVLPVCADAEAFMQNNTKSYDLLITDIFMSRIVPAFVTTETFLKQCRRSINPGGHFVLNYMVNNDSDWQTAYGTIASVFPNCRVLQHGVNRIVVATV